MSNSILGNLLDATLDDLADLPGFLVPPNGAYTVSMKIAEKEVNKKPAIEVKMVIKETVEIANPDDKAPPDGTECSTLYFMDNETGVGFFKELFKTIGPALGVKTIKELFEATASGVECLVVTKSNFNKDKTQEYLNIVKAEVI